MIKPCNMSCEKCGCDDIYRRYFKKGDDTNGVGPNRNLKTTEFVNRDNAWVQPALRDCITHVCRCCGYKWDTAPMENER